MKEHICSLNCVLVSSHSHLHYRMPGKQARLSESQKRWQLQEVCFQGVDSQTHKRSFGHIYKYKGSSKGFHTFLYGIEFFFKKSVETFWRTPILAVLDSGSCWYHRFCLGEKVCARIQACLFPWKTEVVHFLLKETR